MGSPEGRIRAVPSPHADEPADMQARLASLEAEAAELRAEVAALHADLRWLAGLDDATDEAPGFLSRGWLAAGWVRASLLLASVGLVALVSVPYLSHVLDPSGAPDLTPVAAAESAPAVAPRPAAPPATPREEYITVPVRADAAEVPAPARLRRSAPVQARAAVERQHSPFLEGPAGATAGTAPLRGESP
jgi:hypothetical protein